MISGASPSRLITPLSNGPHGAFDAEDMFRSRVNDRALLTAESPEVQDPFWSSTVANLHFNGPVGESVFINTALANTTSGAGRFAPRVGGSAAILSLGQILYGKTSFDSTSGPIIGSNASFSWGSGDATMEGWSYWTATGIASLVDQRLGAVAVMPLVFLSAAGVVTFYVNGTARITSAAGAVTSGNWFHWAWCRASGNSRMFINGVQVGSTYVDANVYTATSAIYVGASFDATSTFLGYHSVFRATRAARYTTTFTPPTVFPDY